jgi:hypothetical protein
MAKQFQGSKKKARRAAYIERQKNRERQSKLRCEYDEAMLSGNIEDMARVMGIKLK